MLELPAAGLILLLNLITVALILTNQRFGFEKRLKEKYRIDRHWWLPPLALLAAFAFSIIGWPSVKTAFLEKFDIIVLILSFGVMSKGLGESGFFRHISYKIVEKGKGKTSKLILYIFGMTSVITFFTTNDIVVLLLTPIIVEICFEAGIENSKLLLLSQFIAANTLSMGLLIGSPTNIIISEALKIDFFGYLIYMALPALIAFGASFLLIKITIRVAESSYLPFLSDLKFQPEYSVPEKNPEPRFNNQMRNWMAIFSFFVALVAVVTYLQLSLLWCAIPGILMAFIYWHLSETHGNSVKKPLKHIPYGIVSFGLTFFAFAEKFSRTGFVNNQLVPFLQALFSGESVTTVFTGLFGSGIMVNLFNDLPAAALVAQTLGKLELGFKASTVLTQASLAGLNIGTYVTPIGALAGLIWFNQMRDQKRKEESRDPELGEKITLPQRTDLLRYGILHFCFTGLAVGTFLIGEAAIIQLAS